MCRARRAASKNFISRCLCCSKTPGKDETALSDNGKSKELDVHTPEISPTFLRAALGEKKRPFSSERPRLIQQVFNDRPNIKDFPLAMKRLGDEGDNAPTVPIHPRVHTASKRTFEVTNAHSADIESLSCIESRENVCNI